MSRWPIKRDRILSDSVWMNAFGGFSLVVDLIEEACRPDRNRGRANTEPKYQSSPPEFGVGDNPNSKGEFASRDQICGELFHAFGDQ
jgi:hypothetical protein